MNLWSSCIFCIPVTGSSKRSNKMDFRNDDGDVFCVTVLGCIAKLTTNT